MELVIASDLQGFTMEQEGCMKQLETFMPGKSQSGKVVIRNGADHKREVFFRADDTTSGKNGNYCAGQRERSDTDSLSGNGDRDDVKTKSVSGRNSPGKG